ncbi:MAG: iron-sulfur cluster assembly accessory protein [Burkholderiales bacterium]|nr:MAG: iron-sulfur cluster assembly accessory protein [Burkholderiales bacterium]
MITLTPAAVRQIMLAAEEAGMEEPLLRVAAQVDEAGDRIEYGMGFDDRREQDEEFDCEGVIVLVSPPSRPQLEDTVLDYVELAPAEFRFVFSRDQRHDD